MASAFLLKAVDVSRGNVPKIDGHLHTAWTDGANNAREMYDQARICGLKTIVFTEHARKTSGDWFPRFAAEVRSLPSQGCHALVGLETKIEDFAGNLDVTKEILAETDLVVASVHRFPGENGFARGFDDINPKEALDLEFRLAMLILDHPDVHVLGHPFGMCYRHYGVFPPEELFLAIIEKAANAGVAIEINSRYNPDPWGLIERCQAAGAQVSLGSDAHSLTEVGQICRILEGEEEAWKPSVF